MMNDKFDKILSNKIRETFENREVEYNPEHWEILISKKKGKKRRVLFLWRIAGVALLLIMVGITGRFLISNAESINETDIQMVEEDIDVNDLDKKGNFDKSNIHNSEIENFENDVEVSANKEGNIDSKKSNGINPNQTIKDPDKELIVASVKKKGKDEKTKKEPTLVYIEVQQKDSLNTYITSSKITDSTNNIENITKNDTVEEVEEHISKSDNNDGKRNIEDLLADREEESNEESNKKSIKFGLNVSPMVNMIAENNNSNIGFSSGVTVEIPVLKKFDVFTGILYTNQKFGLNNQDAYQSDVVNNEGIYLSSSESTVNGIEIPVNIKYNFAIAEKRVFVSAGISSTSYFKEAIKNDYIVNTSVETVSEDSLGNDIIQYNLVTSNETVITNENSDQVFDFASMMNFSFGMEFPINGQRQSIVVEPYIKYSLSPVTQRELDYTNAGFYLRYNFSFKNKK